METAMDETPPEATPVNQVARKRDMSKKQISPYGCTDCVHVWVDRCGLTGHKIQWHVNAKHHCQHFQKERRNENRDGDIRDVARESDMGRLDSTT